ncbi:MAG: substrate-binding periplasmic protein [Roseateles sp.]
MHAFLRQPQLLLLLALGLPLGARAESPASAEPGGTAAPLQLCLSEFAPFNASGLSEGGPLGRIAVQAFARAGIRAELRFMPWARVVKEAEAAQCLIAGLWRNEARDQLYAYAGPYYQVELGYFTLKGMARPAESVNEAQASRICVQRGSYLPTALQQQQSQLQMNVDLSGCLRMLATGRVDIAFGARAAGQHYLESAAGRDLGGSIEWRGPALEVKDHLLAIRKTHPQREALIQAFNRGLAQLRADGSYQRLLSAGGLSGP